MIQQSLLPFKYENERTTTRLTGMAGLPLFMEFFNVLHMGNAIEKHMNIRSSQGYSDLDMLRSIIMMQLAGGESVEDIKKLNGDVGFAEFSKITEAQGLCRAEKRRMYKRFRKIRSQVYPSPSSVFRYLEAFHDKSQATDKGEHEGHAYIPEPNEQIRSLGLVNQKMLSTLNKQSPCKEVTLDMDATLIETTKDEAKACYKHYKAYQPMMVWWWEQGVILHTEFRDGNVNAGHEQLRILKETLPKLPDGVERISLRSDSAGYQHDLMEFCENPEKRDGAYSKYGQIAFSISCKVSQEFRKEVMEVPEAEWKVYRSIKDGIEVKTDLQWAEVCFVPNKSAKSKNGMPYRYIATREPLKQLYLPGMELSKEAQDKLHIEDMGGVSYKVFGIVTNMHEIDGEELIRWHRKRCGKSEEAHGVLKNDLAGGKLPSGKFGVNAAWWWITVLAFNLLAIMKRIVLPGRFRDSRLKTIRYWLINLPGRLISHARQLIIQLCADHPANRFVVETRERIVRWALEVAG